MSNYLFDLNKPNKYVDIMSKLHMFNHHSHESTGLGLVVDKYYFNWWNPLNWISILPLKIILLLYMCISGMVKGFMDWMTIKNMVYIQYYRRRDIFKYDMVRMKSDGRIEKIIDIDRLGYPNYPYIIQKTDGTLGHFDETQFERL